MVTDNIDFVRFRQDHATPEATTDFCSGLRPDASPETVASIFQAAGSSIDGSDLHEASEQHQNDPSRQPGRPAVDSPLDDADLHSVVGGAPKEDGRSGLDDTASQRRRKWREDDRRK